MAAELLFIGQIVPDPTIGGDVAAQARSALARLTVALTERGLILHDLLRLRLFVRDLCELSVIEGALTDGKTAEWPAVSVVELPAGSAPGGALTLDAVAAPGARERRRIALQVGTDGRGEPGGLDGPPRSARLGPWVLVGAVAASTGSAPQSPAAPPATPSSTAPHGQQGADATALLIGAGARGMFGHIEQLLRVQGAELRDVVHVGGWLTFPVRLSDYRPLGDVRAALLAEAGLFPASAAVQVGRVQPGGALLAFEVIAYAPERPTERERWHATTLPPPSPLASYYAGARGAGGYVFTCGEVPTGTTDPDHPAPVAAQAREVYERLGSHLAAQGASPAGVLQQTVFVRHVRDGEAVAEAAREFYGAEAPPPPTTLLPVADIGFHRGCDVEIELIAAQDGRSANAR